MPAPQLVVLDVNQTLSDMSPLQARWEAVGAPGHLSRQWFAEVLRDGFALAAAGGSAPFAEIAKQTAHRLLAASGVADVDGAVRHIMAGFSELDVHPDVPDGLRALRGLGIRLVTLTNGATSVAETLLGRAGLREHLEQLLSVEDAPRWKPAPQAYQHALSTCRVDAADAMLVASHPWDIDGAKRAGLRAAWINRTGERYPGFFSPPDVVARSFVELAEALHAEG